MTLARGKKARKTIRATDVPHCSEFIDSETGAITQCFARVDNAVMESAAYASLGWVARAIYPFIIRQWSKYAYATEGEYHPTVEVKFSKVIFKRLKITIDRETLRTALEELERAGFIKLVHPDPVNGKKRSGKATRFVLIDLWREFKMLNHAVPERPGETTTSNMGEKPPPQRGEDSATPSFLRPAFKENAFKSKYSKSMDHNIEEDRSANAGMERSFPHSIQPQNGALPTTAQILARVMQILILANVESTPEPIRKVAGWIEDYPPGPTEGLAIAEGLAKEKPENFLEKLERRLEIRGAVPIAS